MDLEDGDDGEDYVDDGDDEITAADSDAAELTWKDLKVTSPDGKTVLLYETCGRVKGRFLAIMGPSGAGKVPPTCALRCPRHTFAHFCVLCSLHLVPWHHHAAS